MLGEMAKAEDGTMRLVPQSSVNRGADLGRLTHT
jgi:hypothetical protein